MRSSNFRLSIVVNKLFLLLTVLILANIHAFTYALPIEVESEVKGEVEGEVKYDFSIDPTGGRPPRYNGPDKIHLVEGVALPLFSGWVATQPSSVYVFWDAETYEHGSLVFGLYQNGRFLKNCSYTGDQIHYEYVEITWTPENCYLPEAGTYDARITVTNSATQRTQTFEIEIVLLEFDLKPWPLENDNRGWPPTEPNLGGNLVHNYQSFSGQAAAYWHEGVDIRSELEGSVAGPVHSPVDGEVVKWVRYGSSDLYWSLMVQESRGLVWQFHHLDPSTVRVRVGDDVKQGDILGNIAFWPSSHNGALYHHTHMNVCKPHPSWTSIPNPYVNGWQFFNSYRLLDNGNYQGGIKPSSDGVLYFLNNTQSTAFAASNDAQTPVLSGDIDIILRLFSEFEPTNDIPGHPYENGVYEVGYSVEPLDKHEGRSAYPIGVIPKLPLLRADKTPNQWSYNMPDFSTGDSDTMLRRVYKQSFSYKGRTMQSVFTYTQRTMYYIVTNTYRGEPDEVNGFWDTNQLMPDTNERRFPNGNYLVTVYATDEFGNTLEVSSEVIVRN